MSGDTTERPTDDAPLAASKRDDAVDEATETLIAPKGDAIVGRAVTIDRPAGELYAYWRDFGNLATFMENVERVDVRDPTHSHWVVRAPGGNAVEWDARVTEEEDGRLIAWTSEPGSEIATSGRVTFRDAGDRGTIVSATILYDPPGGTIGKIVAKLFQREPGIQARRDLRRLKQLMEAGEIATNTMNRAQFQKYEEEQG